MTPTASFALTKIQAPRLRVGLIERAALEARLASALATQRLVLLCAPAGFGKTATLARVIDKPGAAWRAAWVSLDDDDDLQRLLACLVAALEPFDPPWRLAPEALIAASGRARPERRQAAEELVNTLAATEVARGLIVLDDLHRVEDPAVFEFLDLLLGRLPSAWGLAIASRVEPPLALARWRVADEVAEFREPDLRFGADEVAALGSDTTGSPVNRADVDLLLARTGGWVVGLRLALRHVPTGHDIAWSRAGGAMDRHAFDYLASEVLDQLPADLREFLLQCAVLPELAAARCNALLGTVGAAGQLAEIERRGLFASVLDGPELTLRLHDLFRDFLEDRLRREKPERFVALLRRAAAGERDDARRIGYLLRAGDWAAAQEALCNVANEWLSAGLLGQTQRLLDHFPAEWARRSAPLALQQGLAAWARWEFAAMDSHFEAARRIAAEQHDDTMLLRARAYVALSHCQMDRREAAAAELADLRRRALPDDAAITVLTASLWHAGDYGPAEAGAAFVRERNVLLERVDDPSLWYQASPNPRDVTMPGMREPLTAFVERALQIVPEQATPLGAIALLMHGMIALWHGDAVVAAQRMARAREAARWLGNPRNVGTLLALAEGLLHALRGDLDPCRAAMDHLLAEADREPTGPRQAKLRRNMQFQALRLAMVAGDTERATTVVAELGASEPNATDRIAQRARELALPAFAAELGQHWEEAARHWQAAFATPEWLDWYGLLTEARLRAAAALVRCGRSAEAAALVGQAWQRCEDDGWPGSALLAGPIHLATLADALTLPDAQRTALQAWLATALRLRRPSLANAPVLRPQWPPRAASPARPEAARTAPVDGLTQRECEVLERIAAGDSNKLIARDLDLSPHTVKRHVANILDKLALSSRGQAAAWWRDRDRGRG